MDKEKENQEKVQVRRKNKKIKEKVVVRRKWEKKKNKGDSKKKHQFGGRENKQIQ